MGGPYVIVLPCRSNCRLYTQYIKYESDLVAEPAKMGLIISSKKHLRDDTISSTQFSDCLCVLEESGRL